jgi:hypothetical protein
MRTVKTPMPFAAQERFEYNKAWAERAIVRDGQLAPIVEVMGPRETVVLTLSELAPEGNKEQAYAIVRMIGIAYDAHAIMIMMEAWTLPPGKGGAVRRPSQSALRQECVLVQLAYRDGDRIRHMMSLRLIERDTKGAVRGLGPEEIDPAKWGEIKPGGLAAGLLGKRPSEEAQHAARSVLGTLMELATASAGAVH